MTMTSDTPETRISLVLGDIAQTSADALVNAANDQLLPGAGVSGALHAAAGPTIAEEARRIGHCPTGSAVATGAGKLAATHVIHAVAPIWRGGGHGESDLLRSAYRSSLEVADASGDKTVAFPSLGTGIYGYPINQAAIIALDTVLQYLQGNTKIESVSFVLFTQGDLDVYVSAHRRL